MLLPPPGIHSSQIISWLASPSSSTYPIKGSPLYSTPALALAISYATLFSS